MGVRGVQTGVEDAANVENVDGQGGKSEMMVEGGRNRHASLSVQDRLD